jgi:site-specific DNA recombinase
VGQLGVRVLSNGNRQRGTGVLNNELYIGRIIWNRQRFEKDPATGKRVPKHNPEKDWIITDAPEMRIISDELWQQTKAGQGEYNHKCAPLWKKNRPKTLLGGLVRCGCCGGGFTGITPTKLGCSASRQKKTCDNRLLIARTDLEQMVLDALRTHLMDDALCAEFCKEYTKRLNELRREHNASLGGYRSERAKLERERQRFVASVLEGVPGSVLAPRAQIVEKRVIELDALLAEVKEEPVIFHPSMSVRYHNEVTDLITSFNKDETRLQASGILRSLIDRIVLTPDKAATKLTADLMGDLAGILTIATQDARESVEQHLSKVDGEFSDTDAIPDEGKMAMVAGGRSKRSLSSVFSDASSHNKEALVAGARFELTTFRLWA